MRVALCLVLLTASVRPVLAAPAARLWFDARLPYDRPVVRAAVDGHLKALVLDSAAPRDVWSLVQARSAGAEMTYLPPLLDVHGRSHDLFLLSSPPTLKVEGLGALHPALCASDWRSGPGDEEPESGPPLVDGVLRPQELPLDDGAVVIDFLHGTLERATWPDALARAASLPQLLADGAALPDGRFVVSATVADGRAARPLRLAVASGQPETLLYVARGEDLAPGAVRVAHGRASLHVGAVDRDLVVTRLEALPLPHQLPRDLDGLLGMDVLRNCILALDARRLVARCRDAHGELGLGHVSEPGPSPMRLEEGGARIALERRGDGYYYGGVDIEADIGSDGRIDVRSLDDSLDPVIDEDERRQLLDATRSLRIELMRAWSLRSSFARLGPHLAGVWRDRRWSARERRAILFRIWNEAAEPDDPELGLAGAEARRRIAGFVRQVLPRGSSQGYSDAELDYYNGQRQRPPRFDPYALTPADRTADPSR